jgi:DNA-binding NtrC family response regulator
MATTRKVFIVDSDTRYRGMLEDHLDNLSDTAVFPFYSAEECIKVLDSEPDVVIVDMHLESRFRPVMDGLDLLKHIKMNYPQIDVVVMSSDDSLAASQVVSAHEPFDVVTKTEGNLTRISSILLIIFRHKALEDNVEMYKNSFYLVALFIGVCLLSAGCAVVF